MPRRPLLAGLLVLVATQAAAARLTMEQVEAKLRPIPVHVLTDAEGAPLVANGAFGVFLDRPEAESFLEELRKGDPALAAKVVIRAIPLSEIVRMTGPGSALQPDFVGAKKEREAAKGLAKPDGPDVGNAPMFVVRSGAAYLTVKVGDRTIIPVFFTKAQADDVVKQYGKPADGPAAHVEVANLEVILNALMGADDPDVERISLVPSEEMMAAVRSPKP